MKQLKFEHKYVQDIKSKARSTTLRIDDKDIKVGEKVQLIDKSDNSNPQEWEIPGELEIDGVLKFKLSKLPLELVKSAEINSNSKMDLYDFLRRFYGDIIGDDTIISLISFTYNHYQQPVPYLLKESLSPDIEVKRVKLYADGGSRGNPGPSAAGFVIIDESNKVIDSWNKYLGITTNNQAEYHGMIAGLEWCKQKHVQNLKVYLDSMLLVSQMNGVFKVKNRDLWTLYETAKKIQASFKTITFTHIPRELNKLADTEVNKALDAVKGEDVVQ